MGQRTIRYFGVIALAMASMVLAQEPTPATEPQPPAETTIQQRHAEGEVVEVTAQMLTIRTAEGQRMTFATARDWTAGAEPVRVGSRVRVAYRGDQTLEVVDLTRLPREIRSDGDNGSEPAAVETRPQTDASAAPADSQRDELPATASPLPLLVAAGLALLGSGVGLSVRRRA